MKPNIRQTNLKHITRLGCATHTWSPSIRDFTTIKWRREDVRWRALSTFRTHSFGSWVCHIQSRLVGPFEISPQFDKALISVRAVSLPNVLGHATLRRRFHCGMLIPMTSGEKWRHTTSGYRGSAANTEFRPIIRRVQIDIHAYRHRQRHSRDLYTL